MKRLLVTAVFSVVLYVMVFGLLLDRPLSLGLLRLEILQKTARLASLPSPKLVILAGSNAPYSHSCAVIGAMLNMPCENAGIAVGIGLDDLFLRYAPYIHAGDVIYMPMETDQYTVTRGENRAAPDAGFLLRHDRYLLGGLTVDRVVGAVFCCDLADLLESAAEMPIAQAGLIRPAVVLAGEYDVEGDRINTTLATADRQLLAMPVGDAPAAGAIADGYGSVMIGGFVRRETALGVIVIGGLPTAFADVKMSVGTVAAIRRVYEENGGRFAVLAGESAYPRADFYDSKDHLALPCQYVHSMAVARMLGGVLGRKVAAVGAGVRGVAGTCPG